LAGEGDGRWAFRERRAGLHAFFGTAGGLNQLLTKFVGGVALGRTDDEAAQAERQPRRPSTASSWVFGERR